MTARSPLRVLHVVEATTAGVGRHVLDLAAHTQRLGLDVTVACPPVRQGARHDTNFVERLAAAGLAHVPVPLRRSIHPPADLRAYHRLLALMREGGFDVVHAHSSKAGALGRLAARRAGVGAVVYTPNAFAFLGAGNRLQTALYRAAERWLGRRATDAVICVSPSELAAARRAGIVPAERLVLIENAIEAGDFAPAGDTAAVKSALPALAARPGRELADPRRPLVGFVGRLAPQKGVLCLVAAAQQVVKARPEAQFLLVGEGELEAALRRRVAQLGLEEHVWLAGYRSDVPRVLAALDVFTLPSRYEGLPYTLMEAMAAGRAVVATDVTGNRDLVRDGETGRLVPPDDAQALAEAVVELLAAPEERARLGRNALAAAQARPTPAEMAGRVVDLYHALLEEKGRQLS